jgi:hypothetical protein
MTQRTALTHGLFAASVSRRVSTRHARVRAPLRLAAYQPAAEWAESQKPGTVTIFRHRGALIRWNFPVGEIRWLSRFLRQTTFTTGCYEARA